MGHPNDSGQTASDKYTDSPHAKSHKRSGKLGKRVENKKSLGSPSPRLKVRNDLNARKRYLNYSTKKDAPASQSGARSKENVMTQKTIWVRARIGI